MQTITHTPPALGSTCGTCPEVARLRDALVAADRLLADLGARRGAPTVETWEDLVAAVEARERRRSMLALVRIERHPLATRRGALGRVWHWITQGRK